MICPKCGREIPQDSVFCPYCHHDLFANENTISLNSLKGGVDKLKKESNGAFTMAILSLIFSVLGGLLAPIFAYLTTSKVDKAKRTDFFPSNVGDIDEYEKLQKRLDNSKKMAIASYFVFFVSVLLQIIFLL